MPTRLVDCSDLRHPKLVETKDVAGTYVALSYVWGEDQPHKTTTRNIATYHHGIDASILPQTINDAIRTTRALGIRYLWTDTLCIIQDSRDDKGREIGEMDRIYNDAYVTIVAASARKVSEGFLQDRAPPSDAFLHVRCPGTATLGKVYLLDGMQNLSSGSAWAKPVIDTRAWCFQEWLLSRRALVFSAQTVEYHCHAYSASLGNAIFRSTLFNRSRLPGALFGIPDADPPSLTADPYSNDPDTADSLDWAWRGTVQDYTERAMTDPGDKLLAIAGVAKQFRGLYSGSRYLAGMWEESLIVDLTWEVTVGFDPSGPTAATSADDGLRPRPAVYRAPSWSWAAVDGAIWWTWSSEQKMVPICEAVRCEITLENEALPFGAVTAGTLVLRAKLVKALLKPTSEGSGNLELLRSSVPAEESDSISRLHTEEQDEGNIPVPALIPEWSPPWSREYSNPLSTGNYDLDCRDDLEILEVYAVLLRGEELDPISKNSSGITHQGSTSLEGDRAVDGILLVPSSFCEGRRQSYRRVGRFSADIPRQWIEEAPLYEVNIV